MQRGIPLFSVLGIRIRLDYTWFIVFVLFAWSLAYGYFPENNPGFTPGAYLAMGVLSSLLLFVCVLIHELSHSYVSNTLGLEVKGITLFIFGGVAEISKEPEEAVTELKVAIAGPVASLLLALLFKVLQLALEAAVASPLETVIGGAVIGGAVQNGPALSGPSLLSAASAVLGFLYYINIVLAVFNMIPGFPLDGGRILRALWWWWTGNMLGATRVASSVGKGFALFLIVLGFLQIISGLLVQGIWAVLIGMFLRQAAEGGFRQVMIKTTLEGVRVGDIMTTEVVTIPGETTIREAVEEYIFRFHHAGFPVIGPGPGGPGSETGGVIGIFTLTNARNTDKARWGEVTVAEVMDMITPRGILSPEDTALEAIVRMGALDAGRLPVVSDGVMVGIISRRDIMKVMEFKKTLAK